MSIYLAKIITYKGAVLTLNLMLENFLQTQYNILKTKNQVRKEDKNFLKTWNTQGFPDFFS